MSEFGEYIDSILAKDAGLWNNDEAAVIYSLIKKGNKVRLNQVMEEVRQANIQVENGDVSVNYDDSFVSENQLQLNQNVLG